MSTPVLTQTARQQAEAALNMGQACLAQGNPAQAFNCFRQAAGLLPQTAAIYGLMADALCDLSQNNDAITLYQRALKLDPNHFAIWNNYGNVLRCESRYIDAMGAYQNALQLSPTHAIVWKNLGLCHQYENEPDKARQCIEKALTFAPNNFMLSWCLARVLPITYQSEEEVKTYRQRYRDGLARLTQHPTPNHTAVWDAFHLHYQGQNDRDLQQAHGSLIHQIMADLLPQFVTPRPARNNDGSALRVGFASSMLTEHTITALFGGWMTGLAETGCEVHHYLIGTRPDKVSQQLAASATAFHVLPNDPETVAKRITDDDLDVLIYPELGMNRHLLKLAALRLAPLQAVTWGHPVTTGLPTIDLFLSSEAMEGEDADDHYTEELVRLPGLSLKLTELCSPPITHSRRDFGLPETGPLFLIPQSLFKLLPKHDWVYGAIAKNLPNAHFCFIANAAAQSTKGATNTVNRRLSAVFDSPERFTFLPGQSRPDFLALNQCADVFLDAPGWSGGRTTLEALGCGLIPISCPGQMMRQRHTAAILDELGWPELIAESLEDYVTLATRLGRDTAWRDQLKAELPERTKRLLCRQDVISALLSICQRSRNG
jgi:protein O-GlcNAc transferase